MRGRAIAVQVQTNDIVASTKASRSHWVLAGLFGLGGFVGYLDRVNLSVIATPIAHELNLSNAGLGVVLSAFLWSYGLAQVPAGIIIDRFGTRLPVLISVIVWAISSFISAFVGSVIGLCLARLLLGLSEASIYPAMWRAVTERFSPAERGRATSCLDIGSKLSYVFGVPVIAGVLAYANWRACFLLTAAISLAYAALFAVIYPKDLPAGDGRRGLSSVAGSLKAMIPTRAIAGVAIGFASYTYVYYLLATWMPRLVELQLGVSTVHAGLYTALPWIVAVAGEVLVAGFLVDRLVLAGYDPIGVRKYMLAISLLASLMLVGAAYSHSFLIVMGCLTFSATGLAISTPLGVSMIGFVAGRENLGAVGASVNLVANISGAFAPVLTGFLLDRTGSFLGAAAGAGVVIALGVVGYTIVVPSPAALAAERD
ncbi:MFS transporter [Gluconacetobacter tumulisoli]|uniref:MFS transporter n=1 Tax=Gluconacetobacter tumulisoli TaxID=1286189 RepID=A0A7W4K9E0_9PROT|nr:MFS transporter [Gluconacetobacter tumulisoli]MBB2202784.1 MFS transporter [Gluconacetobacter tumulisoli]